MKAIVCRKTRHFPKTSYSDPGRPVFALTHKFCVLSGEAANTNFNVFGLTRSLIGPTTFRTRGEHANHYTTEVVRKVEVSPYKQVFVLVDFEE